MNKNKVFIIFAVLIIAIIGISMPADAVLINEPYSGSYEWYSGMGDNLNNTLTQEFSLPAGAQLTFQTWYDIEQDWDYGYVEASTDGGATWATVAGNIITNTNPNGQNSGNGITGNSGGWVVATFNLSYYGGQTTLLRFRYETDVLFQGLAWTIDDIAINGFFDDVESGSQGWTADGWYIMDGVAEPENTPPEANDDAYTTNQDTQLNVAAPGGMEGGIDSRDLCCPSLFLLVGGLTAAIVRWLSIPFVLGWEGGSS